MFMIISILTGEVDEPEENCHVMTTALSISQDIVYTVSKKKKKPTPKHICLGMAIH